MDQSLINRIVEAALLASSQPLSLAQLRELFPEDQPAPAGAVEAAIQQLQGACADRGVELVEVASGFRYQVHAEVHPWVARLWTERQTRYTRATLETLALIAYRQPITRGEIEQVRGVSVSSNIIKALEEREWIRVVGHRDVPGRPALYGTTKTFLDYFGLKRLDELPPLSELKDIGELEPQLQFDESAGISAKIGVGALPGDAAAAQDGASDPPSDADEPTPSSSVGAGDASADEAQDDEDAGDERDVDFRRERPVVFDAGPDESSDDADGDVDPDIAPGMRVTHENDHEQDNAVETTTVPDLTTASTDAAESEKHD